MIRPPADARATTRRHFLRTSALAATSLALGAEAAAAPADAAKARPNILWITCEDISPHLGCYGDTTAVTPNLDRFAGQGVLYTNAFATIGVCAPARSSLITSMYPPSIGSQHMRSVGVLPKGVRFFPEYLRDAGYYCTNNSKTDYNLRMRKGAWDESSRKAHWRKRKPGQPFFSIFNITTTHESRVRSGKAQRDPAKIAIPPYHPDTPEVRHDWTRYAENITRMDGQVAGILAELEKDALAADTIVFFYSDHGAGMPRSKRWLYDSSLKVPLIVRFPAKFAHLATGKAGSKTDRMVSFVDFGATVLSLAGIKPPAHMQGQAFLGPHAAEPRRYVYGFRDRMDERYDMIRCVRDERYKYIRNFNPHVTYAQHISYMYQMPTMKVWQKLHEEGKLTGPQKQFFACPKPLEELYDTRADPHEVTNLAGRAEHAATLKGLRAECLRWMADIHDLGLLPEAEMWLRFGDEAPYDVVRAEPGRYRQRQITETALLVGTGPAALPTLTERLTDADSAVRYWAATGLLALGPAAKPATKPLLKRLEDAAPNVRITAAEALCGLGHIDEALAVLAACLQDESPHARCHAANVLDRLDEKVRPVIDAMRNAKPSAKRGGYARRVLAKALADLKR